MINVNLLGDAVSELASLDGGMLNAWRDDASARFGNLTFSILYT